MLELCFLVADFQFRWLYDTFVLAVVCDIPADRTACYSITQILLQAIGEFSMSLLLFDCVHFSLFIFVSNKIEYDDNDAPSMAWICNYFYSPLAINDNIILSTYHRTRPRLPTTLPAGDHRLASRTSDASGKRKLSPTARICTSVRALRTAMTLIARAVCL